MENCLNSCSFPLIGESGETFKKGMANSREALCEGYLEVFAGTEEMRKCYNEYKFRFMSCAHAALKLKATNSSTTANQLACKKIFEVQGCPIEILESCSNDVRDEASGLIESFVKPVREDEDVCHYLSLGDVQYMATDKNETENKSYQRLAKCMDLNHEAISACIPQKLTVNFLLTSHNHIEICSGVKSFTMCAADIIHAQCSKQSADVFREILSFLGMSVLPFCTDKKQLKTTVTSSPVISTTVHTVKSNKNALEHQEVPSDAGAGLQSKPLTAQTHNHSNHSVADIGLYIIHITPRVKDHGHDIAILNNGSVKFVILLILINFLVL